MQLIVAQQPRQPARLSHALVILTPPEMEDYRERLQRQSSLLTALLARSSKRLTMSSDFQRTTVADVLSRCESAIASDETIGKQETSSASTDAESLRPTEIWVDVPPHDTEAKHKPVVETAPRLSISTFQRSKGLSISDPNRISQTQKAGNTTAASCGQLPGTFRTSLASATVTGRWQR